MERMEKIKRKKERKKAPAARAADGPREGRPRPVEGMGIGWLGTRERDTERGVGGW